MGDVYGVAASQARIDRGVRCAGVVVVKGKPRPCGKLLAALAGQPWVLYCHRCGHRNASPGAST